MSRYTNEIMTPEIESKEKKVFRFTASWCQPCKMLAKMLDETTTDIPIDVIDIDTNDELHKQFGIRGVPTLIMMNEGKEVKRLVGLPQNQKELTMWFE